MVRDVWRSVGTLFPYVGNIDCVFFFATSFISAAPAITQRASVDIVLYALVTLGRADLCACLSFLLWWTFSLSAHLAPAYVMIGTNIPLYSVLIVFEFRPHVVLAVLASLLKISLPLLLM